MALTRGEADRLVALPKTIGEAITWSARGKKKIRFRFVVTVACPEPDRPLRLVGNVGKTNWSFTLLTEGNITLRKLTMHAGGHRNPDGTSAGTHHKHLWDELSEDRETYIPDDVHFDDFNVALKDFLSECNITALGPIEQLARQKGLL